MLGSYLAAALRNLARHRLHSTITTISLAIGFAAMIIVTLYARYEYGFDRFWPGADRIYLVMKQTTSPRGPELSEGTPVTLVPLIKEKVAGVEAIGRLDFELARLAIGPNTYERGGLFWVDASYFNVLQRRVVAGDLASTLADPGQAALSQETAKHYFGDNLAVGQSITITTTGRKEPQTFTVRIGAVLKDLPEQTHAQDDALYLSTRSAFAKIDNPEEEAMVYLKTKPGVSAEAVRGAVARVTGPALVAKSGEQRQLRAVPVRRLYIRNDGLTFGMRSGPTLRQASPNMPRIFLGLGGLILAVASLNFITLMTARGAGRAVEVGVRKASGARRRDLVLQFAGEAVVYAALAFVAGLALAEIILPLVRTVGISELRLAYPRDLVLIALLALCALGLGLVAGLYPALALSSFKPATVLKGGPTKSPGSAMLRQILVTAQFTPALLLAFGALTIFGQMEKSAKNALTMLDPNSLAIHEACTPFLRDRIAALPGVKSAVCLELLSSGMSPQTGAWSIGEPMAGKVMARDGKEAKVDPTLADLDTLRFNDLKLLAGRLWNGPDESGVIVNETSMRRLGYASPAAALGQLVSWTANDKQRTSAIIGVTADRGGFSGFEEPLYYLDPGAKRELNLGVKFQPGDRAPTLASIDAIWKETGALRPMEREFFDDWVDEERSFTRKAMSVLGPIAAAGVAIAGLGLFGLAAFLAEQRTKEIGVRKALGAGRRELVRMLLFQFTRPVLIAALIAVPIVFVLMNVLMSRAAPNDRIMPSAGVYVAVLGGAVLIALASTFSHAWRVTGARPVTALRYE